MTIMTNPTAARERRMRERNYKRARYLREETNLLIRSLPRPSDIKKILYEQNNHSTQYHIQTTLNSEKDERHQISFEESKFLSRRIPGNIQTIRELRSSYESLAENRGVIDRRWVDSVRKFSSAVSDIRQTIVLRIDEDDKLNSKVIHFSGNKRDVNLKVSLAASWLHLTNKIGSPIVNKSCVVFKARQIFDYEDGLVLYEGTVLDIKDVTVRDGYICAARISNDTFIGCFNESLGRAVGLTRSRVSSGVMNALVG